MKNKVLIIYPYINQSEMVLHMVKNLRKNGINADAINSTNLKFVTEPIKKTTLRFKIITYICNLPVPKIKGLLFKCGVIKVQNDLQELSRNYDLIDFHCLNKIYDNVIKGLAEEKIIKVSVWGSDFYRADVKRREEQRIILNKSHCIQISTDTMKKDFYNYFKDFKEKIRIANFGLFQFETISQVQKSNSTPRFKSEKHAGKIMVVCGYNGSEGQQHTLIINAISKLETIIKNKMFLVFPMTYGASKHYLKKVEYEVKDLNIPYVILKEYLSDTDLAKLRIESDIVINIQKTDAFSGSLQEHLYAGNLLLVGDWLPYSILDDNRVFYKKSNIPELTKNISDCIINYDEYKKKAVHNQVKMKEISSWDFAGKRMSTIYKALFYDFHMQSHLKDSE